MGKIQEELDGELLEISVKRSEMSFCFDSQVSYHDVTKLNDLSFSMGVTNITSFENMLFVNYENLSEGLVTMEMEGVLFLYSLIYKLRDILCTCPALQFVVSDVYIKVFIDLPGIKVEDLVKLDTLFDSKGSLELNNARPYVLYVKDW